MQGQWVVDLASNIARLEMIDQSIAILHANYILIVDALTIVTNNGSAYRRTRELLIVVSGILAPRL